MIGSLSRRKNAIALLSAMPAIVAAVPNARLLMVGPYDPNSSYVRRLNRLIRRKNPDKYVLRLGPRNDIDELLYLLDTVVIPSLSEPLGLVAIEAMAAEVPVIAAKVGGLTEIVLENENGLLVAPNRVEELAAAVIRLSRSSSERRRLGENGRRFVFDKFLPSRLTHQVEIAYEHLATNRNAAVAA